MSGIQVGVRVRPFLPKIDGEDAGSPENPKINEEEIQYLIKSVNNYFIKQINQSDIVDTYSGIRPLIEDFKEATKWFYKGVLLNDYESQIALGTYYANGWGVNKDLAEAKFWIKKASENPNQIGFGKTPEEVWNEFELWKY
jgi:glycerol-3-phosphate dehydrogenase